MTTTEKGARLEDVLNELSLTSSTPNADIIDQFVRRYPQYKGELVDFAIELALDAIGDESLDASATSATASSAVDIAMSRLHNRLHAVRSEGAGRRQSTPPNPFETLPADQLRAFMTGIHANPVFVMKLRDRHIDPTTIPAGLRRLSAELLSVPESVLAVHWAGPPMIAEGSRFKSERKPEASKRQSFAEAVATSSLNEEQQRYLLSL